MSLHNKARQRKHTELRNEQPIKGLKSCQRLVKSPCASHSERAAGGRRKEEGNLI